MHLCLNFKEKEEAEIFLQANGLKKISDFA